MAMIFMEQAHIIVWYFWAGQIGPGVLFFGSWGNLTVVYYLFGAGLLLFGAVFGK